MSKHSYTRCWLHLIWGTLKRERLLVLKSSRIKVSDYLKDYAETKKIFMKNIYINSDHVHALIDLPTNISIEDLFQLFKGSSSHWINQKNLLPGKFSWGRGYAAFSVSHSNVGLVANYIANQAEHHRIKSFSEEYEEFIRKYELLLFKEE